MLVICVGVWKTGSILCMEFYMFSLGLHGFPLGALVTSLFQKMRGGLASLNCPKWGVSE